MITILLILLIVTMVVVVLFKYRAQGQIRKLYLCKRRECKGICIPDTPANQAPYYFKDGTPIPYDDLARFLLFHSKVIKLKVLFGPLKSYSGTKPITDPMATAFFLAVSKQGRPYLIKRERESINEAREYSAVTVADLLHEWHYRRNLRRTFRLLLGRQ